MCIDYLWFTGENSIMNSEHLHQSNNGTEFGVLSAEEIEQLDRMIEATQAKDLTEVAIDGLVPSTTWVSLNFRSTDGKRFRYVDVINWPKAAVEQLLQKVKNGFADENEFHTFVWGFYHDLADGLWLIPKDLMPHQATPRIKSHNI